MVIIEKLRSGVFLATLFVIMLLAGCTPSDDVIVVAAAASLTDALQELEVIYEEQSGIDVVFTFAGSGTLLAQIENGAEVDLFMPADISYAERLAEGERGNREYGEVIPLLANRLVLVTTEELAEGLTFENVLEQEITLAIGDPTSVPAGKYAVQALGIEGGTGDVNLATDVRQVLTWVSTGAVEAGIVYETDAKTEPSVIVADHVKDGVIDEIIYPVMQITQKGEAESFQEFILSDEAMSVFEKYGFTDIRT